MPYPFEDETDIAQPEKALEKAAARLAMTADGVLLFTHLRKRTIERPTGPDAGFGSLLHLEGQRSLVHYIESLAERGRKE